MASGTVALPDAAEPRVQSVPMVLCVRDVRRGRGLGAVCGSYQHAPIRTYWITEAGYDLLGILAMYELLRLVLRNLARRWWARLISQLPSCGRRPEPSPRSRGSYLSLAALYYIVVSEIAVRLRAVAHLHCWWRLSRPSPALAAISARHATASGYSLVSLLMRLPNFTISVQDSDFCFICTSICVLLSCRIVLDLVF